VPLADNIIRRDESNKVRMLEARKKHIVHVDISKESDEQEQRELLVTLTSPPSGDLRQRREASYYVGHSR
jgi:hypothetical protein